MKWLKALLDSFHRLFVKNNTLNDDIARSLACVQNRVPAKAIIHAPVSTSPNEPAEILHMVQATTRINKAVTKSKEPERAPVRLELWYPGAQIKKGQKIVGKIPKGHPEGAIIHYTAGRRSYKGRKDYESGEQAMLASINEGKYAYFIIGMDGTVWQSIPIDSWGYHAGKSYHSNLNTTDVSKRCVGIELCNAGILENNTAWFKEKFTKDQVRTLKPGEYQNCKKGGQFLKYTPEQEEALEDLLLWLADNSPVFSLSNVYGHDEVAPDRKSDPGGALSMSMPEFRAYLKRKKQA